MKKDNLGIFSGFGGNGAWRSWFDVLSIRLLQLLLEILGFEHCFGFLILRIQ